MKNAYLSPRQRQVFDWIQDRVYRHDLSPSIREIGDAFGIASTFGVVRHLRALRRKGYITWDAGKCRTIRIVRSPYVIPVLGRVS